MVVAEQSLVSNCIWGAMMLGNAFVVPSGLWCYWTMREQDPIKRRRPQLEFTANIFLAMFVATSILAELIPHSMVPIVPYTILVGFFFWFGLGMFTMIIFNLVVAFSLTNERLQLHSFEDQFASASLRIRWLKFCNSDSTATAVVLLTWFILAVLQVQYIRLHPHIINETLLTSNDEFLDIGNYVCLGVSCIALLLAWKIRIVEDTSGVKKSLTKVGIGATIGLALHYACKIEGLNLVTRLGFNVAKIPTILTINYIFYVTIYLPSKTATTTDRTPKRRDLIARFLDTPDGFKAFSEHLQSEFSIENALFWKDVRQFEREFAMVSIDVSRARAQSIYDKYLTTESLFELNLSSAVAMPYRAAFTNPPVAITVDMFIPATEQVLLLISHHVFLRFMGGNKAIWDAFERGIAEDAVHDILTVHRRRPSASRAHYESFPVDTLPV